MKWVNNTRNKIILIKESNKKIKKSLPKYYLKSNKGHCLYEIIINKKCYICVHNGSLYYSLKYHLERALRDYLFTKKTNLKSFHTYIGINDLYKISKFRKNGGKVKLLAENINSKDKLKIESDFIKEAWNKYGKENVWNIRK